MLKNVLKLIVMSSLLIAASPLQAVLTPLVITSNPTLAANPKLSFFIDVLQPSEGKVDFVFHNESKSQSSIVQIHFDDGDLLGIAHVINGPGTSFSPDRIKYNKHWHWGCDRDTILATADTFSTKGNSSKKGVNPDEWVKISFDLAKGATFDDVIAGLNTGDLSISAQITSIKIGCKNYSASAVNTPEPATLVLLGIGTLALVRTSSKK